jgi:hypothetical protein
MTLRHHMKRWWVQQQKPYDLNYYTTFLSALYRLKKNTMDVAATQFFTALSLCTPLLLSSHLRIMPSPSLTLLHFHNAGLALRTSHVWSGGTQADTYRQQNGGETAGGYAGLAGSYQQTAVRAAAKCRSEPLPAGQLSYGESTVDRAQEAKAVECRSRRYASRERPKEQQHAAKQQVRVRGSRLWKSGKKASSPRRSGSTSLRA